MIDVWLGLFLGWLMPCCVLRCMLVCVCVSINTILSMPLIGLRHKTQWEKANLRVRQFWMLNTFPRPYFNSEPISLVVRSIVLPREDAIYIVPKPLQKLSGELPLCPQWFGYKAENKMKTPPMYKTIMFSQQSHIKFTK